MAGTYEEALDSCITRLMQGESLNACLALYPEYASELEADLRPLQRELSTFSFTPSEGAKRRGRLMLEEEIARLEEAENSGQGWWEWLKRQASKLTSERQRRWAVAVPAVLLVLVLGGAVTTAAAGGAVPGDLLYPVKRTTEEVQLAFSSSDFNRAKRQIEFAQRRADEIEEIFGVADDDLVLATSRQLSEHMENAARITLNIDDDSDAQELASLLTTGASRTLSAIEQTVATASGDERLAQVLEISGEAYGQAVESAGARNETHYVAGPPGMLRTQAVDPPPEGVDSLLVEITNIAVFLPAGSHSKWVELLDGPITVDLIRAATTPQMLTQSSVESGAYSRLRITVNSATIVIAGISQEITVQQGAVELVRPFQVLEDQITTLTLDFDSAASLQSLAGGQFSLTPVIHLLAEEPVSEHAVPGSEATPTPSPGQTSTPTVEPAVVELHGTVEATGSSSITVNGIRINLGQGSSVPGDVETGSSVEIQAQVTENGDLLAVLVTVIGGQGIPATSTPAPLPTPTATAPATSTAIPTAEPSATPDAASPTPGAVSIGFTGELTAIEGSTWQVDGYSVQILDSTVITGVPLIGMTVRVEGKLTEGGSVIAQSIMLVVAVPTIQVPVPTVPVIPTVPPLAPTLPPLLDPPTATPTPTAAPTGTPAPTPDAVDATPTATSSPTPSATPIPTPTVVVVEGLIVSIAGDSLVVGSATVTITPATSITGILSLGVTVRVTGTLQPDGTVLAESIAVEELVPLP